MMNFWEFAVVEKWYYQVVLIYHEVFLRTLRIARFRRKDFFHDQVELVESLSKKFYQVALIDRAS